MLKVVELKIYCLNFQSRNITYAEFSQFLHDFHEEYALVAFKAKDKDGTGFISVKDFYEIMISIKSHLLTEPVTKITITYFRSTINLISL